MKSLWSDVAMLFNNPRLFVAARFESHIQAFDVLVMSEAIRRWFVNVKRHKDMYKLIKSS